MNQHLNSSTGTPTNGVGHSGPAATGSNDDGHYQIPINSGGVHHQQQQQQQHHQLPAPSAYGYDHGATGHLQPLQQQPMQHLPMQHLPIHSLPQHYPMHTLGQQGHSQSHTPQLYQQQAAVATANAPGQGQAAHYAGQHHQLMTPNPYQQYQQQQQLPHLHPGGAAGDTRDHLNLQFNPMAYQQQTQHQQYQHLMPQQSQTPQPVEPTPPGKRQPKKQKKQVGEPVDAHALAQQHHMEMLARASQNEIMESTTRKVAPRSSDLFRVGPPFNPTKQHAPVYVAGSNMQVFPTLHARIDRGFEPSQSNSCWIGYKRNYFSLVSSFEISGLPFEQFLHNSYYTVDAGGPQSKPISYFAIRLTAKCSDDDIAISLIQHTAKRDKGPQFAPPIYPALPGELPDHETVKASCNKRNSAKIEALNKVFFFNRGDSYEAKNSILRNYPSDSISKVARFERIQFTSSIRVKATNSAARYFTLAVELLGIVEEDSQIQPVLLSSIESPPLIIRGRSPSSYHKDRTSGYRAQS
ncbi:hypothetical protein KGF57_003151 [Candida theae]|uniref:NDT80 domain-containing protein n=1 Tax=Candida theae TaxID=1198502 RepID=A0AAD5FXZ5_9ASCO|nr:uncharacterized protein KGF57_003151 [Candida theae]KAI5957457.1 hypothetical protein KGF57_003151 [Candida theae]